MCLARCVREMWASKYGTVGSALKISQNARTFAPFPDTVPPKITIAEVCSPYLLYVGDDCFRRRGQVSAANVRSRVVSEHVR